MGGPDGIVAAVAWCARGQAELWLGRPDLALEALREAMAAARDGGLRTVEASASGAMALAYVLRGRLRQAESSAAVAVATAAVITASPVDPTAVPASSDGLTDMPAGLVEAHLAHAMVAAARVDDVRVTHHLDLARMAFTPAHPPYLPDLIVVLEARARCRRGEADDVRAARRLLASRGRPAGPPLCLSLWRAAETDLLIAVGNAQAARQLLGQLADTRRPDHALALAAARANLACADLEGAEHAVAALLRADGGGGGSVVSACVVAAVAAARRDDHGRATDLLARALALAEDEGLAGPFLEFGGEPLAILDAHPGLSAAHPFFVSTLRALATMASAAAVNPRTPTDGGPVMAVSGAGVPPVGAPPVGVAGLGAPSGGMPSGEVAVPAPAWPATPRQPVMSGRKARPALMTPAARSAPPNCDRQGANVPRGPRSGPAGHGLGVGTSPISLGQPGARERSPGSMDGRGPGAGDRLSDRELAVLSYLPTMLTTAEIAAELFVSVNTVKTHLKSIYRKLDVPRRRDAVHRARELRLL